MKVEKNVADLCSRIFCRIIIEEIEKLIIFSTGKLLKEMFR